MFVENYRIDATIGGQARILIPYPKISDEDWQKWKAFLPVKSVLICKKELFGKSETFFETAYGIPPDVCHEMVQGANISKRSRFGASVRSAKIPSQWALPEMASAI
jgi:hypothetical protein